jgi:uncharacterized membrane protein YfcA
MNLDVAVPELFLLPLIGAAVAGFGTAVGLGGGFIMMPILMFIYPDASPATITSISLTVVFLNALSATASNYREKRIDWRTVILLVLTALPASVLGALVTGNVNRDTFQTLFGALLIIGAGYIFWKRAQNFDGRVIHMPNRNMEDRRGGVLQFYVNELVASGISPVGGFISSFFGIGGGVVNTPVMIAILKIPPHVAGATSLAVLVPTSLAALLTHVFSGQYQEGLSVVGLLGIGSLIGAQVGVYLVPNFGRRTILTGLSFAMAVIGAIELFN